MADLVALDMRRFEGDFVEYMPTGADLTATRATSGTLGYITLMTSGYGGGGSTEVPPAVGS